jgi:hypothetical protein
LEREFCICPAMSVAIFDPPASHLWNNGASG